ncbi:hypothetical protein MP228_005266 [Amoeboaphelidium protococcarum]|nr:hypothetical protein MP228_005266 [Amoeboaphelidium protococcarum]
MTREYHQKIKKLPQDVINKIAAGEVIHRPSNALKEMLENSIDAGADRIDVIVKDGGLKMMQITDNGHGIALEDLPLLCERHATSKLETFEDLLGGKVQTFGFRGEALASISHCAKVTVISKTADGQCAYRAWFANNKLVSDPSSKAVVKEARPQPCAHSDPHGTVITVEDLFYSLPMRRKAFSNTARTYSEEHARIVEVVSKYAIHYPHIKFTCKKQGSSFDVNTLQLPTGDERSRIAAIQNIIGKSSALKMKTLHLDKPELYLSVNSIVSDPAQPLESSLKSKLVLFINNRLVESNSIRKAVEAVYNGTHNNEHFSAQSKGSKQSYWVYLSLQIDPRRIDVNVHPTKREVQFLNEVEICQSISSWMISCLFSSSDLAQRTLTKVPVTQQKSISQNAQLQSKAVTSLSGELTQSLIGRVDKSKIQYAEGSSPPSQIHRDSAPSGSSSIPQKTSSVNATFSNPNPARQVRTDSSMQKLDSFAGFRSSQSRPQVWKVPQPSLLGDNVQRQSIADPFKGFQQTLTSRSKQILGDLDPATKRSSMEFQEPLDSARMASKRTKQTLLDTSNIAPVAVKQVLSDDQGSDIVSNVSTITRQDLVVGRRDEFIPEQDFDSLPVHSNINSNLCFKERQEVNLASIKNLRQQFIESADRNIGSILQSHTFVGVMDDKNALVQYDTKLLKVNYYEISYDFFYGITLRDFSNFGSYVLSSPVNVQDLISMALRSLIKCGVQLELPQDLTTDQLIAELSSCLINHSAMFQDYFAIAITEDGSLKSIPLLIKNYIPNLAKLPLFILRLASEVTYDDEETCLQAICHEIAQFYQTERFSPQQSVEDYHKMVELVLFEAFKSQLASGPSKSFGICISKDKASAIQELAELSKLYRVFERC